ncbi:putative alpha-ketoglutarate-dependent sulfonate dioxygenase [Lachnellula arida]|uniref:Putative alpha-ketoglutarate-dependent sulfonate dioxygenase n=1 Tax=Lachnellula arida TaxID=1316785 RepID=A0A8T9BA04_9HELO|nr:putative alpha-ketoglutarate-dependent sulfonate dioxygenase [Lachnellula arida]
MTVVPETGGDTIFASGYEAYDRLSPAWKRFAETLTATHRNATLKKLASEGGDDLISGDRGSPDNRGLDFEASHPVIRTNPVTGWKSIMAAGHQVHDGRFDNVTPREDQILKEYFVPVFTPQPCNRIVSVGEKPYLDPNSTSRRAALSKL